jgi:hypothetical protein
MYLLYALCAVGMGLDLRLRLTSLRTTTHSALAGLFLVWTAASTAAMASHTAVRVLLVSAPPLIAYLVIGHGVQTFRGLERVAAALLAVTLALGVVGFLQARAPFQCVRIEEGLRGELGRPDGRSCGEGASCNVGGEPGYDYMCEKAGPLGSTSIGHGRVRYRGLLQDPNEFALALALAVPLAMAFFARRRSPPRLALLLVTLALVLFVVVETASRTGQVVLLVAVGAYFVSKVGWKGVVAAAVLVGPVLVLGGRHGEEADVSAAERPEAWSAGLLMWRSSPLWGVGRHQFLEHHYITAHNTFVLELAELGLVGLMIWVALFWASFKILHAGITRFRDDPEAAAAVVWGRALLAVVAGVLVGCLFLSLSSHPLVWTAFGLSGAYYLAVRHHDPGFEVRFGRRDAAGVAVTSLLLVAAMKVYVKMSGF